MSLEQHVKDRFSSQLLVDLTRNDSPNSTTINDTLLTQAADDAKADLEIHAGVAYDDTDNRHVVTGIKGVLVYLQLYKAMPTEDQERLASMWERALEAFAKVTGRNKILPKTTSQLTPSDEVLGSATVRPWADSENLDSYVLRAPGRGAGNDRVESVLRLGE